LLVRDDHAARASLDPKVEIFVGDLARPQTLDGCCEGVGAVFHLASHSPRALPRLQDHDDLYRRVVANGTQWLVQHARAAGAKKFILASTLKVFGEFGCDGADEATPPRPDSAYGRAKVAAEQAVLSAPEIGPTIVRLAPIYGVGNNSVVSRLIVALSRRWTPLLPDTQNRRSMVHFDDVAAALTLVATRSDTAGRVYHLTDGMTYSTRDIIRFISEAMGRPMPRWTIPGGALKLAASAGEILEPLLGRSLPFNRDIIEKLLGSSWMRDGLIRNELGFSAKNTLATALPEMVAKVRESRTNGS
jgi:nucleoside-diphosphate-sugar epimerase